MTDPKQRHEFWFAPIPVEAVETLPANQLRVLAVLWVLRDYNKHTGRVSKLTLHERCGAGVAPDTVYRWLVAVRDAGWVSYTTRLGSRAAVYEYLLHGHRLDRSEDNPSSEARTSHKHTTAQNPTGTSDPAAPSSDSASPSRTAAPGNSPSTAPHGPSTQALSNEALTPKSSRVGDVPVRGPKSGQE